MKRIATRAFGPAFLLGLAMAGNHAVAAEPLRSVVMSYSIRQVSDSGVTQTMDYKERVVRGPSDVWIERVIPAALQHVDEPGHKHLNKDRCARWISKNAKGVVSYWLVDTDHRVLVEITPNDYDNVGFDGRWDRVYNMISPESIQKMQASDKRGLMSRKVVASPAAVPVVEPWKALNGYTRRELSDYLD